MPSKKELLDLQFVDARHMLINLAAFLDRIDRHPGEDDHRLTALKAAIPVILENRPDRAKALLESMSDHSTHLPQSAPFQGATGAPPAEPSSIPSDR